MDTPDKTDKAATSSLSKFEDSPVFNYINSLSPIEQVKFGQADRSFNSLTFASPSSVFASPQIISLRESRLKSNLSPDPLKPELSLFGSGNKVGSGNKASKVDLVTVRVSDQSAEQLGGLGSRSASRQVTADLPNEPLGKYDCGSPACNWTSSEATETSRGLEVAGVQSLFARSSNDSLRERQHFKNEVNLRKICRIEQTDEAAGCNWVSLISDAADLNDNSPVIENNSEEQDQEAVDPGTITFVSTVLQLPQDNANDLENMVSISSSGSCKLSEIREMVTQSGEIGDLRDKVEAHDILSNSLQNKLVVTDARAKVGGKEEKCGQSSCKLKIRRRCLVFETKGSHKTGRSLIPSQSDCEVSHEEKHLVPSKTDGGHSLSMLPSVGLHLNALATTSKNGKFIKCKTLASGKQLISMRSSMSSDSLTSNQSVLLGSSTLNSMEKDSDPGDRLMVAENALQTSVTTGGEEADQNSPRRKRFKLELAGESMACKRCNCKRSKCLKLYCECFAAGLYCVEPCSCLDCFNKPMHEDTVLETRRQIESRNPLAFAPKVIRSTDSAMEFGDETNKTPASARHKRGCNCRRSSCLKKYCECFQGGVGCSVSCRCEGCQNAFGRKDGFEEIEYKGEESEARDNRNESADTMKKDEDENPDVPLIRPSIIARLSRGKRLGPSLLDAAPYPRLCTSLKPKTSSYMSDQPNFQTQTQLQVILEDETPKNLKSISSPTSPHSKRLSPPPRDIRSSTTKYSSRKLILRSIHQFPSVTPLQEKSEFQEKV